LGAEERTRPAKPACFDSRQQWEEWYAAAEVCQILANNPKKPNPVAYCTDCTPEHQARMIREKRCGWPGVTFSKIDGPAVFGRRPGR
jgi:hypothetical protein